MIDAIPELDGLDLEDPDAVVARLEALASSDAATHAIAMTVLGQALVDTGSEPFVGVGLDALMGASESVPVAAYSAAIVLLERGESNRPIELLASAAAADLAPAQALLGELLVSAGEEVRGLELLLAAALGGEPRAAMRAGLLLADGQTLHGLGQEEARGLLETAADAGVADAEAELLRHLLEEGHVDAFLSRLSRAADRRRLSAWDARDLGSRASSLEFAVLIETALALAPQDRDVRAAFVDGILLSESTLDPDREADLRAAFALEHPFS